MNACLNLWTDGALLCIFDPTVFEGAKPATVWPPHSIPGVRDGRFAVVGLEGDCCFRLRLTDSGLTEREKELVGETVGPLGLEVGSGRVYASGMDFPGEASAVYADHGAGAFVELAQGNYNVTIHELLLQDLTESERNTHPDFVAVVSQRSGPFAGIRGELCFLGDVRTNKLLKDLGTGE